MPSKPVGGLSRKERQRQAKEAILQQWLAKQAEHDIEHPTLPELLEPLTPRETEVALCFAELLNAKQVARQLGSELATVRNHLMAILVKLDLESHEHLVAALLLARYAPTGLRLWNKISPLSRSATSA